MSFPDKQQRKVCWDSRDRYWECLDEQNVKDSSERPKQCADLRKIFEKSCPTQWVSHFDRKRDFNVFKEKMVKEGFRIDLAMEELENILHGINIPTKDIKLQLIQTILSKAKREHKCTTSEDVEVWDQISKILWFHLQTGLNNYDDQLLCATCFYTVLTNINKQDHYLKQVANIINDELISKRINGENTKMFQVSSLMYGLFQSAFLTQSLNCDKHILSIVLKSTFDLLMLMAYEYSRYTYIAFKTIGSFKKVHGTDYQSIIFNITNQVKLLNLTNHNWENPITGVKDLNRTVFKMLISVMNKELNDKIVEEVNTFPWNKAKYLMLSEIIEQHQDDILGLIKSYGWIDGLTHSLHKQGLVSAGADMYFSILKKLRSDSEWRELFSESIYKIFKSSSYKAIENFTNYWWLTTIKNYPSLMVIFLAELENVEDVDNKLYGCLSIMKQGNKMGLITKKWSDSEYTSIEKNVINGLEHCDVNIRSLAFDITCMTNSKSLPTPKEYELVLSYLNNNVNSDCTVLRLNMLNSLNTFLTQLHSSYLNNMKHCSDYDQDQLLIFLRKLQEFVVTSLNFNGNYQRKISTVKICKTILNCITEVPRKRQNPKIQRQTLLEMVKENDAWILHDKVFINKLLNLLQDPADDVRENIIQLLFNHYSVALRETVVFNSLISDASKCVKSKFFYEISCGHSMYELIVNILIKEGDIQEASFETVEAIFNFVYNELNNEYDMKRDIVESIKIGKQLHSYMSTILVVLEVCNKKSYAIKISNEDKMRLVDIIDDVSNQFAWEQQPSTSSDFSKMNDMVQDIIEKSGHVNEEIDGKYGDTQLSGLHQIVLNCLWLNVKASCDLASILVHYIEKEDMNICEKLLNIITHVLETSRHKGAIEAAGVALGKAIQHLTNLPESYEVSKLPYILLKSKLNDLITEASKMASITRRGAGLSIMVHRIVSSDMNKSKPLFHFFMKTLLKTCTNTEDIPSTLANDSDIDNQKDLPKAIYIHFLTRIVTDSSLASDMMFYSAKLAELAFNNLKNPHWQIRNAALQLYGALIPKLIGQKKASGNDDETIATVGCDEFRTHSPKLWSHIKTQLKTENYTDDILFHSNLMPILNILANSAKRYAFSNDVIEQKHSDAELLNNLLLLLGSPIYTVRRLTAKCIFNMFSFEMIYDSVLNKTKENINENFLHGCLALILNCYKHYYSNGAFTDNFKDLEERFSKVINSNKHSYLCKELFECMFDNKFYENCVQETFAEVQNNKLSPGVFLWLNARIKRYIDVVPWKFLPTILATILDYHDYEQYCDQILVKLKAGGDIQEESLVEIAEILLSNKNKYNSSVTWKLLYEISLQVKLDIDCSNVFTYLEEHEATYKLRYMIPFIARVYCDKGDDNSLYKLSKIVNSLSDFDKVDIEMRYIAAMANNEIAYAFNLLSDNTKAVTITTAVMFLQDEDEDVRNLTVNFYKIINNLKIAAQPYICLLKLLETNFLCQVFNKHEIGIELICEELSKVCNTSKDEIDNYNPFANNSKNIYLEVELLNDLMSNIKSVLK